MAAPTTPTKGQKNSTWPTPPSGGAVQALLLLQEPCGSGWSFRGKQNLTLARQNRIVRYGRHAAGIVGLQSRIRFRGKSSSSPDRKRFGGNGSIENTPLERQILAAH